MYNRVYEQAPRDVAGCSPFSATGLFLGALPGEEEIIDDTTKQMEASSSVGEQRVGQPVGVRLKKACSCCRQAHAACDGGQPCQRCASLGQAANCRFLPARKRGRPPKGTIQFDSPTAPAAAPAPSWTTTFSYETTSTASLSTTSGQSLNTGPGRGKRQRSEPVARPPALVPRPDSTGGQAPTTHTSSPASYSSATSSSSLLDLVAPRLFLSGRPIEREEPASPPQVDALVNPSDGIAGTVLSLLAEQMRDMRRENRHLREEVRTLNSLHKRAEHRIEEIQEENRSNMERILNLLAAQQTAVALRQHIPQTPFSQPIDPVSLLSHSQPPRMRAITHILPFLSDYDLRSQPVVIDDLSKPFAAYSVNEPSTVGEMDPPVFIYASPAFCHITGFDLHELLGRPITLLCRGMDHGARDRVLHFAFASIRGSRLGPTFDLPLLWASKKRHTKMLARSQFFFNDAGRPKWMIIVIDDHGNDMHRQLSTSDPSRSSACVGPEVIYDEFDPSSALANLQIPCATDASPDSFASNTQQSVEEWSENSVEGPALSRGSGADGTLTDATVEPFDDLDALWMSLNERVPSPGLSYT